jgi:hypothetical protein
MRKFGIVKTTTLQTNATQIVGPSEKRHALYFSPPQGANEYTVSTEASVQFGGGINLSAASGGFLVTAELYGDAVSKPWFGAASGTNLVVGFVESTME